MLKVREYVSEETATSVKDKVKCPVCGRILSDIKYVKGIVMLRIKCSRCKSYIDVDVTGN